MWLKSLAFMLVAVTYAQDKFPEPGIFLYGSLLIGPVLWGGLYLLNDITDIEDDRRHPIKHSRPLSSDRVSTSVATPVALLLITSAIVLSLQVNVYLFLCVTLMAIKQGLYTLPPFRFKEKFALDVVTGSLFNSTLRFLSGWFLVTTSFEFPLLLLVSFEALQTSLFLSNRIHGDRSEHIERQYGYDSTVVRIPRRTLKIVTASLAITSLASFSLCGVNGMLRLAPEHLCVLPMQSLLLSFALLVSTPPLLKVLREAEELSAARAKNLYIYSHVFLFLLSVALAMIIVAYE